MNNKILKTLFIIILLLIPLSSFAWDSKTFGQCSIKDNSPEIINNYLKKLRKIISNLNSNVKKQAIKEKSSSLAKNKNILFSEATWLWNSLTSWNDYSLEFKYWLYEPIFNNVPSEIKRDHWRISNELDQLNNLMSQYTKKWYLNIEINGSKVCNWIENCKLSDYMFKSWDILIKLISSTKNIKTLIELWVTDKWNNPNLCNNVFFISNSQCNDIYWIYNTAKQECQDKWVWNKIKKAATNFKFAKNWIQKWEEAWAELDQSGKKNKNKYEKLEKKLLTQELSRQWVPSNQAAQILKNLDDYNGWSSVSIFNNPIWNITNTITNIISNTQELKNSFKESIFKLFKKDKKDVTIKKLISETKKNTDSTQISKDINKAYQAQLPLAKMQDLDTNQVVGEIIRMNNSVMIANNTLWKTIPFSEKTCKSQWEGQWICKF